MTVITHRLGSKIGRIFEQKWDIFQILPLDIFGNFAYVNNTESIIFTFVNRGQYGSALWISHKEL